MRKAVACCLYWLGCAACFMMFRGRLLGRVFFEPYQKLMCWSYRVQGPTDKGPWRAVEKRNGTEDGDAHG